ncbi:MAG TPA: AsmA-like C-terminal region-containing protein [Bacteroidales bacterium]|nr:AsmA-like C-terminal region-containing protein [Bacteroidales bacterium]
MKLLKKIGKILFIGLVTILLLMAVIPYFFPGAVKEKVKNVACSYIDGNVEFKNIGFSFFRHFPHLTFNLDEIVIKGPLPFQNDTLLSGKSVSTSINLLPLLKGNVEIDGIYLDEVFLNLITDKNGKNNYEIVQLSQSNDTLTVQQERDASFKGSVNLKNIVISNSSLRYFDSPNKMALEIDGLNYRGKGNIKDANFLLLSLLNIKELSFAQNGTKMIDKKGIKANFTTNVNLDNFKISLLKNKLKIAGVKTEFHGYYSPTDNGYSVDMELNTSDNSFKELFSLLPEKYSEWLANTKIKGNASIQLQVNGVANDSLGTFPDLIVAIDINKGSLSHAKAPVPLNAINLSCQIILPSLNTEQVAVKVNNLSFNLGGDKNKLTLEMKGLSSPLIKVDMDGSIDLETLSNAMGFENYKAEGKLDYKILLDGIYNPELRLLPVIDAKIRLKEGAVSTTFYPGTLCDLNADIEIKDVKGNYSDLKIVADPFNFNFDGKPFTLTAKMENFDNLKYKITSNGQLNLDNLYRLFAIDGITLKGEISTDLYLSGNQQDAKAGRFNKLDNRGQIGFRNFEFMSQDYPFPFRVPDAVIIIDKDKILLSNAILKYRDNTFRIDGYAKNFMGYFFEGGKLTGNATLTADSVNLDDFRFLFEGEEFEGEEISSIDSAGVIRIPSNFNLSLNAHVHKLNFAGTRIDDINGGVRLDNEEAKLKNTTLQIAGARFLLSANYKPLSHEKALFDMSVRADSFDIHRAYNEIPLFKELVRSAESIYGKVSLQYSLKGELDREMSPIYPSLKGSGYIRLDEVKINGLRVLSEISKATGRDSLDNPELKGVLVKSSINNNIVTIERTKMRIFGFRPRFEGQVSLDGRLNIKFRLGLPPFGIIGIPVTVTGTMDNPKVHLRRSQSGDILYETEPQEEADYIKDQVSLWEDLTLPFCVKHQLKLSIFH